MPKYEVLISLKECPTKTFHVYAEDFEEAKEIAREEFREGYMDDYIEIVGGWNLDTDEQVD